MISKDKKTKSTLLIAIMCIKSIGAMNLLLCILICKSYISYILYYDVINVLAMTSTSLN